MLKGLEVEIYGLLKVTGEKHKAWKWIPLLTEETVSKNVEGNVHPISEAKHKHTHRSVN